MKTIFSEDHSGVLVKMLWPQSEEDARGRIGGGGDGEREASGCDIMKWI